MLAFPRTLLVGSVLATSSVTAIFHQQSMMRGEAEKDAATIKQENEAQAKKCYDKVTGLQGIITKNPKYQEVKKETKKKVEEAAKMMTEDSIAEMMGRPGGEMGFKIADAALKKLVTDVMKEMKVDQTPEVQNEVAAATKASEEACQPPNGWVANAPPKADAKTQTEPEKAKGSAATAAASVVSTLALGLSVLLL